MAQFENYTGKFFGTDFMKGMMPSTAGWPFDMSTWMETQRKNMQAVTEVQQKAAESIQGWSQRQTAMWSKLLQENSELSQWWASEGTPEEKIALQADWMRKAYENSITEWSEMSEWWTQSGKETTDIINERVTSSLTEFKSSFEKPKAKSSKAA